MERVFSENTVRIAAEKVRAGEKPVYSVSEKLSREELQSAWSLAYDRLNGMRTM